MSAPERIWANNFGGWSDEKNGPRVMPYVAEDLVAADTARLAAVRAFIAGQTRHNCALVRTLREMLE